MGCTIVEAPTFAEACLAQCARHRIDRLRVSQKEALIKIPGIPSAAKAAVIMLPLTAGLKSRPFKTPNFRKGVERRQRYP
jgi:hypothetical protein